MPINWVMVEALASALYAVAFMASIILVLRQLRKGIKDEFLTGTATTFAI